MNDQIFAGNSGDSKDYCNLVVDVLLVFGKYARVVSFDDEPNLRDETDIGVISLEKFVGPLSSYEPSVLIRLLIVPNAGGIKHL